VTSSSAHARATGVFRFTGVDFQSLRHGMSLRHSGAGHEGDVGHSPSTDAAVIEANRDTFLHALGINPRALTVGRQTHGTTVRVVTDHDRGRGLYPSFDGFPATDGLATRDTRVAIGVIVADCVPLLMYDPVVHAVAVVHAGWRGTVGLIASEAVRVMSESFDSRPEDLRVAIGPSIGPCCYEVGDEVIEGWQAASAGWGTDAVARMNPSYHFDLWTANRLALLESGVHESRIMVSGICVRCHAARFFSYRAARQDGLQHGRMLMVAQLHERAEQEPIVR
jgi:polyphenol oxidase